MPDLWPPSMAHFVLLHLPTLNITELVANVEAIET